MFLPYFEKYFSHISKKYVLWASWDKKYSYSYTSSYSFLAKSQPVKKVLSRVMPNDPKLFSQTLDFAKVRN